MFGMNAKFSRSYADEMSVDEEIKSRTCLKIRWVWDSLRKFTDGP